MGLDRHCAWLLGFGALWLGVWDGAGHWLRHTVDLLYGLIGRCKNG